MYSSFANMSNSPLIYWFTIGMLIAVPIAMFIIGIRGVRKDNPNDKRAGYAMLKLAGVVMFLVLAAGVFLFANGAFRQPAETAVILSTLF
jgi:hypothetical protein